MPHNGNRWKGSGGNPSIGTETLFRPSRPPLLPAFMTIDWSVPPRFWVTISIAGIRSLHRQGCRPQPHDGRTLGAADGLLQGQGRFHAHRGFRHRDARCQRHRRRKNSLAPARQAVLEGHRQLLDEMLPRVRQVIVRRRNASFTATAAARARLFVLSCLPPFAMRPRPKSSDYPICMMPIAMRAR